MVTAGFFSIGTVIGLSIVVPLYLELVLGFSASGGGIALIAYVVGTSFGSLIVGPAAVAPHALQARAALRAAALDRDVPAAGVDAGRLVAARHLR